PVRCPLKPIRRRAHDQFGQALGTHRAAARAATDVRTVALSGPMTRLAAPTPSAAHTMLTENPTVDAPMSMAATLPNCIRRSSIAKGTTLSESVNARLA